MPEHDSSNLPNVSDWRPKFIREIREHAEADGLLQATHDILQRDNIIVTATGDVDTVRNHEGGLLFVGNHNKQFEFVALMDVLSQLGRTSMKNIVKFYVENQVTWGLGSIAADAVLPVYPRLLATDRKNKLNAELGSRLIYRKSLKNTTESKRLTDESLQAATVELCNDGVVNIFPCGSIVNNIEHPWRAGVGQIVSQIPTAAKERVLVVPYHADNINRVRLLAAVAVRGKGMLARPQYINLTMGRSQTAAEVVGSLPEQLQGDPKAITDALRHQYVTSLIRPS